MKPRRPERWSYSYWRLPYHTDYSPPGGGLLDIDYVNIHVIHNGDRPYSILGLDYAIRIRARRPKDSQFRDYSPRFVAGGVLLQPSTPPRGGTLGLWSLHPDNFYHLVTLANVGFVDNSHPGLPSRPPNSYDMALAHYYHILTGPTVRSPFFIEKYLGDGGLPPAPAIGEDMIGETFNFAWGNVRYDSESTFIDFPAPPGDDVAAALETAFFAEEDLNGGSTWVVCGTRIRRQMVDQYIRAAGGKI